MGFIKEIGVDNMNIYAWIGMIGILILTFLPFLKESHRTKIEFIKALITTLIVFGIIISVSIFGVNYLLALLIGVIIFTLLDKKTYTKKRLIIYGLIILIIGFSGYYFFSDNPDYVLNHLKENPTTTSFFAAKNAEELVTHETDTVRPLASTVKIIITVEYAMQVDAGILDPNSFVHLAELNKFYIKNTDGGAHEAWLETINKNESGEVTLQNVAKGMITYSSNANTDYMINLLGANKIDKRIKELGLKKHEAVYPLVGSLLIPQNMDELTPESLKSMSNEEYRKLAFNMSEKMQRGEINADKTSYTASQNFERIWSDRLIGATANDYGKLLEIISNDELPKSAMTIIRDLMEWPMEINPDNKDRFNHLGSKGGSTGFILNDATYAEDLDGNQFELVLLMDDLNLWQRQLLQNNINSFESKFIGDDAYKKKVIKLLGNP